MRTTPKINFILFSTFLIKGEISHLRGILTRTHYSLAAPAIMGIVIVVYLQCKENNYDLTRSLGALRAPTSSWRPFGPLDFVLHALRALRSCDTIALFAFG